ncbi:hypothetical protein SCLCIDRAFT_926893 [Scleroderma citrinum Foug A]|uniref:Uncharacterized protein n=1 Tax=Scleroderma citrinum Foug A TaxID=1036808 RepID=A0A0C3D1G9_9AGAM|nr:hypothetical protein SCLCIDRAFT_926893 [Scleroderma citrinum Foug A]
MFLAAAVPRVLKKIEPFWICHPIRSLTCVFISYRVTCCYMAVSPTLLLHGGKVSRRYGGLLSIFISLTPATPHVTSESDQH